MSRAPRTSAGLKPLEEDGDRFPLGHLGGLVLAAALLALCWLRADSGADAHKPRNIVIGTTGHLPMRPQEEPPAVSHALMEPYAPTVPDREPLAGVTGAVERFGDAFAIRHPDYLPADIAPFTVNWQPDSDPQRRAAGSGELLSWFYSAEHGAVLVLAQGRGVGVRPLMAGDDRAGRLRLADGTDVIWLIGHQIHVADSAGEPVWEGTELTLGVQATDGEGWYLRTPIIPLAELIRVADSLK